MPAYKTYVVWTPEQDALLRTLVSQRVLNRDIVTEFARRGIRRTVSSVRTRCAVLGLVSNNQRLELHEVPLMEPEELPDTGPAPAPAPPPPDPIEVEQERQERLRALRAEREALRDVANEKSLRATLEALFRDIVAQVPPLPPIAVPPGKGTETRETLLLHLSDWHYGEIVDGQGTRGMNAYNTEIARRRVSTIVQSAIGIAEKMRAGGGWAFPRLVVALNGDLVSGTIHELERHSDPKNIVWSVYECGLLLAESLRVLAEHFPQVDVFCTSGNHGRLPDARRMQSKDPTRNWDTLVALIAKKIGRAHV